jgi:outer membrane biogenesis lipoprotein LolB
MKLRSVKLLLIAGFFLAGCTVKDFIKPSQQEIDTYVQEHPDLPELDKSCIYDGRFEIGIKQETLYFLLGEPYQQEKIQQPWALQEKWVYKKRHQKIFIIEDRHVVGILENEK